LAITAARAAMQPGLPLAALASGLRDTTGRLDALDAGDEPGSVRAAFSWSYRYLSPAAARMFRLLGLHPGPHIPPPAPPTPAARAPTRGGVGPRPAGRPAGPAAPGDPPPRARPGTVRPPRPAAQLRG